MKFTLLISLILPNLLWAQPLAPVASTGVELFEETTEHDVSLRKTQPLYLAHSLGQLTIHGWAQDRIRVKITKRVFARGADQAKKEFEKFDLSSLETRTTFELRVGHVRGVDLVTKMRDQTQTEIKIDLEIYAPYQLDLSVLLGEKRAFFLDLWKGRFQLTGKNSVLNLQRLNLKESASVNCVDCELLVEDSKLQGHFLLGERRAVFRNSESTEKVFLNTRAGEVKLEHTQGNFAIHTESGRLSSQFHSGDLNFHAQDGGVYVNDLQGNLEASTKTGQMIIDVNSVSDYLRLETQEADIQVTLMPNFEGILDLLSTKKRATVQFVHEPIKSPFREHYGPDFPGQIESRVGEKTSVTIRAHASKGSVRILRKVPQS